MTSSKAARDRRRWGRPAPPPLGLGAGWRSRPAADRRAAVEYGLRRAAADWYPHNRRPRPVFLCGRAGRAKPGRESPGVIEAWRVTRARDTSLDASRNRVCFSVSLIPRRRFQVPCRRRSTRSAPQGRDHRRAHERTRQRQRRLGRDRVTQIQAVPSDPDEVMAEVSDAVLWQRACEDTLRRYRFFSSAARDGSTTTASVVRPVGRSPRIRPRATFLTAWRALCRGSTVSRPNVVRTSADRLADTARRSPGYRSSAPTSPTLPRSLSSATTSMRCAGSCACCRSYRAASRTSSLQLERLALRRRCVRAPSSDREDPLAPCARPPATAGTGGCERIDCQDHPRPIEVKEG